MVYELLFCTQPGYNTKEVTDVTTLFIVTVLVDARRKPKQSILNNLTVFLALIIN